MKFIKDGQRYKNMIKYTYLCQKKEMHPIVIIFFVLSFSVNLEVFAQTCFLEAVAKGLRFQIQADSTQRLVEEHMVTLFTAPKAKRNDVKNTIRDLEALAVALQKKANEWFDHAYLLGLPDPVGLVESEKLDLPGLKDPAGLKNPAGREPEFSILPKSPYSAANPVPVDVPMPDGVVYKIQLGAFRNPSAASTFKGLSPISGETLDNGVVKYYAGLFRRFADADNALRKVHEYGFKDAFIVAFYNRKTINIGRARQLESDI